MKAIEVSKRTIKVLNISFLFVLFSGLLWQVTQISMNYFKFDVVSSIRIILPGIERPKAMNICFDAYSVRNRTRMARFMETFNRTRIKRSLSDQDIDRGGEEYAAFEYLSRSEMFYLTLTSNELFPDMYHGNGIITERSKYGLYLQICYQLASTMDTDTVPMNQYPVADRIRGRKHMNKLEVSTYASININDKDKKPPTTMMLSDIGQMPPIRSLIGQTQSRSYRHISSYFYDISKLSKPYSDHCIDYNVLGFRDKFDTIQTCIENITVEDFDKLSRTRIFTSGNDNQQFMFPDSNTTKFCHSLIPYDDCHRQTHILAYHNLPDRTIDTFHRLFSDESSYEIVSQAKIDDIDYVTYIFGAMGTWFGFSFLMMNPFGYFLIVSHVSNDGHLELENEINQLANNLINQLKVAQQSIDQSMNRVVSIQGRIDQLDTVSES